MLSEQEFYFHSYVSELFVRIKNIVFLKKIKKAIYERMENTFKKNHKKILVTGMGRTGTILLSNCIRDIVPDPKIVKHNHYFDQALLDWADIVVSTKRDFREQIASTERFLMKLANENKENYPDFGPGCFTRKDSSFPAKYNTILEECEMAMKIYNDWKPYVLQYFEMEQFFIDPERYIYDIFVFFNVAYDDNKIKKLVLKYKDNSARKNHITKSDKLINYNTLSDNQLNKIDIFFNESYSKIKKDFMYIEKYLDNKNL